jgi:hypothetical protein
MNVTEVSERTPKTPATVVVPAGSIIVLFPFLNGSVVSECPSAAERS